MEAVSLDELRAALEASWDHLTSYGGAIREGCPAFGQCYPTSRVLQWFMPELEIVSGRVWTGTTMEDHFWTVTHDGDRIDLTWSQFPPGSTIVEERVRDRTRLGDSPPTVARCELLRERVQLYLRSRAKNSRATFDCG